MLPNSDYLLDAILQESKNSNKNLAELKSAIASMANSRRTDSRRNPPAGNPGRGGANSGSMTKLFGTVTKEMGSFTRTISSTSSNAQTAFRGAGSAVSSVAGAMSQIPGPVGATATAFKLVVDAGMAVYDYMQNQLRVFQEVNSSGITMASGMAGVKRGANDALMSIDEFSAVIRKNSLSVQILNDKYGDGVGKFGELMNQVQLTQREVGAYGISQQTLADITARNIKFQKLYTTDSQLRNMNETSTSTRFVKQLNEMSKVMGVSIEELLNKTSEFTDSADFQLLSQNFQDNMGKTENEAALMANTMATVFGGLGESGKLLAQWYPNFINNNLLPEDVPGLTNINTMLFDRFRKLNESGVTDAMEYHKAISEIVNDPMVQKELMVQMKNAQLNMDTNAARQIAQLNQMAKLSSKLITPQQVGAMEQLTTRFDLWLSNDIWRPVSNFFSDTSNSLAEHLLKVVEGNNGFWNTSLRLLNDKTDQSLRFIGRIMDDTFMSLAQTVDGWMGKDFLVPLVTNLSGSFTDFVNASRSFWDDVVELTTGTEESSAKAKEQFRERVDKLFSIFNTSLDEMKDYWNRFKNWVFGGSDETTKPSQYDNVEIKNDDVMAALSTMQVAQSTAAKYKTPSAVPVQTQQAQAKPEYTQQAKIQEPTPVVNESQNQFDQISESDKEMIGNTKKMLNKLDEQIYIFQQMANNLREVADNTVPETNK